MHRLFFLFLHCFKSLCHILVRGNKMATCIYMYLHKMDFLTQATVCVCVCLPIKESICAFLEHSVSNISAKH